MPRVTFQPTGAAADVASGTSLLDAARTAGVRIRNDCGGRGACGRCVVQVKEGHVHRLSTRYELKQGEDLACRVLALESDVTVFVPKVSREAGEDVSVREIEPLPAQFPPPEALVKRVRLAVPPPTLQDNLPDDARLVRALEQWRKDTYRLPHEVLTDLPVRLRDARWEPEVTVAVSPSGATVLEVGADDRPRPCILAVDVGTTAVKAELLAAGSRWAASCYNSQLIYGPDVISRIIHCQQHEDGLERMQRLVVGDVNRLLTALMDAAELEREDVWAVVASGNTTMMHLLLGLHPTWIRREPYVGCSYRVPPVRAVELGIGINPRGRVFTLPSVGAYVGADITAGVLATGLCDGRRPAMLIDLGTNGEIVIGHREFMVCCSASAGPAFEGEASASGTRAMPGAIDGVWWEDGLRWSTMDDQEPVGICGSGYIDLLAVLAQHGILDKTGRFQEGASPCLRRDEKLGAMECVLVTAQDAVGREDILLTQGDIDNLIRGKAAIYAAANVLLESLGMKWSDLELVMLAGAFGDKIDKENAVRIGLLPDVPRERIKFVGNTSLQGTIKAALDEEVFTRAQDVARRMTYFELSTHPGYMEQFVAACFLPHTDLRKFPSVTCAEAPSRQ
jgi:uncharacterized 2Fe-2S/4Fe-4S cluster protein (DUF4445 family)